jgi:O-antigen/teichoic acid export membrane protein
MGDGLKNKMIEGLAWSTVNVFGVQAIQLVIGILLARLLNIEDFGQVGILFFFVGISTVLVDGGFGQALIRKKDATETDKSTIFFLNLLVSVCLYLILYVSAPSIANFFKQPELINLARVLFLSVVVFSFYFIQYVSLLKKLDYKSIAIINLTSVLISSVVAVILAYYEYGVWVLVYQQLTFHVAKSILSPFFLRWKPIMAFSKATIKESWKFSAGILAQTALNAVFNNIYTLLIGKFDTIRNVGYYTQANKYSETVNVASNSILTTGTYPIFAQVQDDIPRLLRIYRRLITSVTMLTFPLAVFLVVSANPLIVTLISDKWLPSVFLFQLLIVGNLFYPIYTVNVNILNARGESKNTLRLEIFKKILIVISIVSCFSFGIKAMLTGLLVANFISFAASTWFIKKSLTHYFRHQFLDLSTTLIMAVVCGGVVALINFTLYPAVVKLMIEAISFAFFYFISVRLIYPDKWKEAKDGLLKKIKPYMK